MANERKDGRIPFLLFVVMIMTAFAGMTADAQRVDNYTISRQTGITYSSISGTGNSVGSWRHNNPDQVLDDNRSYPVPIGFDFWYDGVRYTEISIGINGLADFSTSTATGYTPGDYDSDNPTHNRLSNTTGTKAWDVLAPMYGDLTTQDQVDPLGSSFKYLTTGTAPNRVFTVEWINLSVWNQINTGTSWNFQLKLYESTGVFEFVYGDMISGAATLEYKTGINAPDLSGGLSGAVLLIQQSANSTNFQPYRIPGTGCVTTLPESNSKLIFTAPVPADPTNLTFTNVSQVQMRLNWNDNANNEAGYAIYNSLDGVNYSFIAQTAAGSTNYTATGLLPGTIYYWKVYAVTEGQMSNALENSQTTDPAVDFISRTSGRWSRANTWVGNQVPTANSNVTIADGHTVQYDVDNTFNNINVGSGTSGALLIGRNNNNTAHTMNVLGSITVNSGAQLTANSTSTATHQINITGDLTNNGILDLAPDANSRCRMTFNRNGNQTLSGAGTTTNFYQITLDMGSSNANLLDVTSANFTTQGSGFLIINNGTFRLSSPAVIAPFTASTTIPSAGGLWVNNPSAEITTSGGNLSYTGFIRITEGTLNVGTLADQRLISDGGELIIEGGTANIAGSFDRTNDVTLTKLTMSGGTLRVATIGSTSTTLSPFIMDVAGSSFNMTGGRIVIAREGGTGAANLGYVNTGSTIYTVAGGILQIGDYSTPAGQTMQVNSAIPLYDFTDSSANATAQLAGTGLQIRNDLLVYAGTLDANNLDISIDGNWTDQGNFIPGSGTVTFTGNSGSVITDPGGEIFNSLVINKQGSSVNAGGNVTVNNSFTLSQGIYSVGSGTLILNGNVSASGGTMTSLSDGTVNYNQSSAGQTVLAMNYGNLTLSAFSKNFPSSTVGIASVFTVPAPSASHVMTGNTIDFNGSAAQTVPATGANFIYNNLSLTNGSAKSVSGPVTIAGNLTVGSAVEFNGVTNDITVNGNIANSGIISGSGNGNVVLTDGSSSHLLSGNGAYGNITMDDAAGAAVSGKMCVNGLLTLNSGIIATITENDTVSFGPTAGISRTIGHIVGNVQVYIPAGTSSKLLPIGNSTLYLPVRMENVDAGTAGYINVSRVAGQHPQISDPTCTIDSTRDVTAYWKIVNNGVTLNSPYSLVLSFDSTTECIGGASPTGADFSGERWDGSKWSGTAVTSRWIDSTRIDGLDGFGDFILGASGAALLVTVKTGMWNDPDVWGGRTPGQNDTAMIVLPYVVTLDNDADIAKLVVDSGGRIYDSTFTLTVSGDFVLDGLWDGNGTIKLTTSDDTIYGSGSVIGENMLEISGNKTIASGSTITLRKVTIFEGDTLYNEGEVTIDSLYGIAASSEFVNNPGSTLTINGPLLETGTLDFSQCMNTVIYNGSVNQSIKPVTYCNIVISGSGIKTAASSFDVKGDLSINSGSNLVINNGITLNINGAVRTAGNIDNNGDLLISD